MSTPTLVTAPGPVLGTSGAAVPLLLPAAVLDLQAMVAPTGTWYVVPAA